MGDRVKMVVKVHCGTFLGTNLPFRAEKPSAQASAHPLSQAQGGLFGVLTVAAGLKNDCACVRRSDCFSFRSFDQ